MKCFVKINVVEIGQIMEDEPLQRKNRHFRFAPPIVCYCLKSEVNPF